MIVGILQAVSLCVAVAALHELGHLFYARSYLNIKEARIIIQGEAKPYVKTEIPMHYNLRPKQTSGFIASGVIMGALLLMAFYAFSATSSRALFFAGIFYLVGCRADIVKLWRIKK